MMLVDDHAVYRHGLRAVLSHEDDIAVVAEADDGNRAVALADELHPDVVLMDVRMPRGSGVDACRRIREAHAATRVIMMTTADDQHDLHGAVSAGANGYLLKDVSPEEVAEGIRTVHMGQSLISPAMASRLLDEFAAMIRRSHQPAVTARLTKRETQVLGLVTRGLGNKEIARELFISENTVKNHVRSILEKLQLNTRMEAALYAVRERLVEGPPRS